MASVPVSIATAAAALAAALAAIGVRLSSTPPPVVHSQCVMAVGNFEATQFNPDSLFFVDSTGKLTPTKAVSVTTTGKVPPAYVNRNVEICFNGAAVVPSPACVTAVSAFYANEVTGGRMGSGGIDTVLYVPPKGALLDSLIKADSAPNGALIRQPDDSFIARPVQICPVKDSVSFRAVLTT